MDLQLGSYTFYIIRGKQHPFLLEVAPGEWNWGGEMLEMKLVRFFSVEMSLVFAWLSEDIKFAATSTILTKRGKVIFPEKATQNS